VTGGRESVKKEKIVWKGKAKGGGVMKERSRMNLQHWFSACTVRTPEGKVALTLLTEPINLGLDNKN